MKLKVITGAGSLSNGAVLEGSAIQHIRLGCLFVCLWSFLMLILFHASLQSQQSHLHSIIQNGSRSSVNTLLEVPLLT